jgi:hypothetical protein
MVFRALLGGPALLAILSFAAPAYAFDFNGMWASDPELCGKIFIKKGKQVTFAPLSDFYGSGFIIEGDRVRGKIARCKIKSRKEDGDTTHFSAACATTIALQDLEFSLKVVDDNTVTRLLADSPAMSVNFHRCPP